MSDHPEGGGRVAVPANPYAPPASDIAPLQEAVAPRTAVPAARVAGVLLLASAPAALMGTKGSMAIAVIIDVLLGISLVRGSLKYRWWTILRACVGALFFGGQSIVAGERLEAAFVTVYAGCYPLLLLGTPSKGRTIAGAIIGGLLVVLTYVGLLMQ
jgi:hypothetical protein